MEGSTVPGDTVRPGVVVVPTGNPVEGRVVWGVTAVVAGVPGNGVTAGITVVGGGVNCGSSVDGPGILGMGVSGGGTGLAVAGNGVT